MAVTRVHQREIVEVPFDLPDGRILTHMALVLSCDELQDYEDGLFYAVLISSKNHFPELTIPIDNAWLNKPLSKQSYFITHIVKDFNTDDVINRYNNYVKQSAFVNIVQKIVRNVTSLSLQPNEK